MLSEPCLCQTLVDEMSEPEHQDTSYTGDRQGEATESVLSGESPVVDESLKEIQKQTKKRIHLREKGSEGIRKRTPTTSGMPIRKKRSEALEAGQAEYDSKLVKNAKENSESSVENSFSREEKHRNFKCDRCGSPFITNPMIRGNKVKKSKLLPSPRHKLDPETKKILSLCNACGLAFNRTKKLKKAKVQPTAEEKQLYLDESRKFADGLVKELQSEEAQRFYCTYYTKTPCGCIQRFIGDAQSCDSLDRARTLLGITLQAKEFKSIKVSANNHQNGTRDESQDETEDGSETCHAKKQKKASKRNAVGIGNGQKKSKPFESYVLEQRAWLKEKYGFCETGTKRVLLYSNNFLHKRSKTDPEQQCRVVRQKGKSALGKLNSIEDLPKEQCCVDNCVRMAHTHQRLLEEWREKSKRGQAEARRVIAEMLTPSGGSRTNCYKFISRVTGRSLTTIGKVNDQMKKTGGNREPPEHGLKRWWKNNPKPKKGKTEAKPTPTKSTAPAFTHDTSTPVIPSSAFMQPLGILQAAANSSGLTAVIQNQQQQQQQQQAQYGQSCSNGLANNSQIIALPPNFITIQAGQGMPYLPMNNPQLQSLQLLQLQILQQQQNSQINVAVNPVSNVTRQPQATAPTMVSSNNHQNTFFIATASPNIIGSLNDACVSPIMSTPPQQNQQSNASQQPLQPQFLHIAPIAASPGSLLFQNNLPGLINIPPQLQTAALTSSGNFSLAAPGNLNIASTGALHTSVSTGSLNMPSSGTLNSITSNSLQILPPSSSTGADQFLSNESNMSLFNAGNVSQLISGQPTQVIPSPQTGSGMQANTTPLQVSFISSG